MMIQLYIVRKPNKIYDSFNSNKKWKYFLEIKCLNYLDTKFNALEWSIPYDSKAVSAELYEKFNSYIKTAAEDNNFKNQIDQTLKQIYLSEVMGNLQHSFSMKELEEVHPNRMGKYIYNTDIKDKYRFDLFDW